MPPETVAPPSRLSNALAKDRIGALGISLSIASSVAPLTVVAGVVMTALAVTAQPGISIGLLTVGVVLLIFAVGYLAMARRITNAGAFYAYAAQSLGRPVAVGVALVALVTYNCFQVASYGGVGAIGAPMFSHWFGIEVQWWLLGLLCWLIVGVLGIFDIGISEKVLAVLVIGETVAVLVYAIAIATTPGFAFSLSPLAVDNLWGPGAGALIAIGFTAFAGLEQAAAYAEEARDARRNVSVATYATISVVGTIYVFAATVIYSAAGSDVFVRAGEEGPDLFFNLAAGQLGTWSTDLGYALFLTSLLAAMIAFHNLVSRYMFSLGREGVLPRVFGRTAAGAPRNASLAQSALGLLVITVYAAAGWDPLVQLFFWGGTSGGFGVLLLVAITSISVIVYFTRHPHGETLWRRRIAPGIAMPILLLLVYLTTSNLPVLYGVDGWSGPAWLVPTVYLLVFCLGLGWGVTLRRTRPEVYGGIGLGPASAVAASTAHTTTDEAGREPLEVTR
ncbi:APC family permease [Melissospora conviva]|uniref:APC family permease n=1 Tax=Melissospora conviva TaxID=3388432 RepID=UPI003C25553D